jgi:hypothetical protein
MPSPTPTLDAESIERLIVFALGLAAGLALAQLGLYVLEQWIIESDLADRRRVVEVLADLGLLPTPPGRREDTPRRVLYPETTPR